METRLLIAGEQVAGEGPGLDVENPYTQTTLATVALPSSEQVDAAIRAARAAARGWADTPRDGPSDHRPNDFIRRLVGRYVLLD